ncbi:ABC transporter substrate-binding protein [Mahella australiensis]|uniref:Extracellular solute-binding protein family 1 n=1 Tax=Mahella australiensis (strain DSM 15567 / CIP 107919 / 50-1 BON) TaxID=697281 RepID=F3ZY16_MAHA5|nr:ABC transporter substrate-binding protein [Mahella australiensis]AEE97712.1 extracellular solute-binding protein family 1 [Mahella australiensis 50-1 BON]
MIRKRYIVLMASLLVIIMALLSACNSNQPAGTNEDGENSSSTNKNDNSSSGNPEPVEVTYWHMWTSDWGKLIDEIVAEFNKTHPNIKVKALSLPTDAETKFLAATTGGDAPDVFTEWNMIIGSWAESGAIQPLDQFIDADAPDMREWMYPICKEIGTYQGKTYAIPMSMNVFMLWWNKDIFKEAGLDPDKPPETIEELDAIQSKLWKINDRGIVERVGFFPGGWNFWMPPFGGDIYDEQNDKVTPTNQNIVKMFEWFQSYVKPKEQGGKGYDIQKVDAFNKSSASRENAMQPWLIGKQAIWTNGMWILEDIKNYNPDLNYGVASYPYPKDGGKPNSSWINGNFNVIPANAKHPKEAWEFIKWLAGYGAEADAAKILPKGGWIPVSPKVTEQPEYQKFLDEVPVRRQFVDLMSSENVQITPVLPYQQYLSDRMAQAETRVLHNEQTPLEALQQVEQEVTKEAAKYKK